MCHENNIKEEHQSNMRWVILLQKMMFMTLLDDWVNMYGCV